MNKFVKAVEQSQLRTDLPNVEPGDHVRVHLRITEGTRQRIQVFEGTVIARNGSGLSETFTVRRVSYGVGVERILYIHSPKIAEIEVVRRGVTRRAKLYYLRDRVGKKARLKERLGGRRDMKSAATPEEAEALNEAEAVEAETTEETEEA